MGCKFFDLLHLAQDMNKWRNLANTVMELLFSVKD